MQFPANRYPSINPHLNSFLQQPGGGWNSLRSDYLTYLRAALDRLLPAGYYARTETSLQIGVYDLELGTQRKRDTIGDVTIYGHEPTGQRANTSLSPTLTLPLETTLLTEEDVVAVVYQLEGDCFPGHPTTRIELLSPANKPGGS
jgi:hypothetical protein